MKGKTMKTKTTQSKVMKTKRKKRAAKPVEPGTKVVKTTGKMRAAMPAMPVAPGTEVDLEKLRESALKTYESLRNAEKDDFTQEQKEEYWRNRHLARTAWELAENAAFANLVEEQKRRLPEVAASNARLAKDAQATADALAVMNLVSASLGVLAEVITLLGRVVPI
jgi:hypothetical protein